MGQQQQQQQALGQQPQQQRRAATDSPPTQLHLDVVVFKEDGAFVARAPLTVSASITLGELKEAIAVNTKGALPPSRQCLRYLGQVRIARY
jgi:hypothetical protein